MRACMITMLQGSLTEIMMETIAILIKAPAVFLWH